jgi:ATP-binding cassette subfamily B protein
VKRRKQRTLLDLTRGHRLRYLAAIAAMGVGIVFLLLVPQVSRVAIDAELEKSISMPEWLGSPADALGVSPLWIAAVTIVVLTGLAGYFQYLRGRWAAIASEGIARGLRNRLYSHIEALPCSWHDRTQTGDLVQRCSSDVETIRVFFSGQIIEMGRAILLFVTVLPMMLALDARMTLVSIATFPILFIAALVFFRKVRDLFKAADEAEGRLTTVIQENLTGIRVVRAFARQEFERDKFGGRNAEYRDKLYRLIRLLGNYYSISDFFCMAQIGMPLVAGCWWMSRGELSVGTLFTFVAYVSMVIWPIRHLGRVLTDSGKAMVSLGRIGEVLAADSETDLDGESAVETLTGAIEVEDLTFAFGDHEPVLHGISFTVAPGETLALLGPPGSGKSVLIHLLLRLYDYERGAIRIDGHELRDLPRRGVRSRFGVVLQEPFLYSKTIGANLRLGRRDATEKQVVESAAAAAIHGSIEGFDDGYETMVGERGVTLSGGQRQRVSIARALLKEPDVLVLDDALSAVDTKTEAEILASLKKRNHGKTTILIAHRISSVMHADRILVLEEGRIVQDGTHDTLVGEEGPYRRLWRIQGALEEELGEDLRQAEDSR